MIEPAADRPMRLSKSPGEQPVNRWAGLRACLPVTAPSRYGRQSPLVLPDRRPDAPPLPERCSRTEVEHDGRQITVLRL